MIHYRASTRLHRELLIALESVRTQLAVAIACERKSTPPERLRYYFETADEARRLTKKLRSATFDRVQSQHEWSAALERLKQAASERKAMQLCECLREIAVRLE